MTSSNGSARRCGASCVRINHIGSTAVVGLAAKDVIDVQVSVESLDLNEDARHRFDAAGFPLHDDGPIFDHIPIGAVDAESHWAKRMAGQRSGDRRTHVHIRAIGRPNERYPLLFRDYLRANGPAAGSYGLIKVALARLHPGDVDAYYAVKDPVCDLLRDAAERWAMAEGWQVPPSDA